jgi:hypothetical protein
VSGSNFEAGEDTRFDVRKVRLRLGGEAGGISHELPGVGKVLLVNAAGRLHEQHARVRRPIVLKAMGRAARHQEKRAGTILLRSLVGPERVGAHPLDISL